MTNERPLKLIWSPAKLFIKFKSAFFLKENKVFHFKSQRKIKLMEIYVVYFEIKKRYRLNSNASFLELKDNSLTI